MANVKIVHLILGHKEMAGHANQKNVLVDRCFKLMVFVNIALITIYLLTTKSLVLKPLVRLTRRECWMVLAKNVLNSLKLAMMEINVFLKIAILNRFSKVMGPVKIALITRKLKMISRFVVLTNVKIDKCF